ncbi:hypothetical protein K440DRAFT_679683 [Wilcoxina mikolae CBS 423.85]|nr:hypothetical protein K440DRAFT_679683 [Wilcoxina mikolae CBS 423.85]
MFHDPCNRCRNMTPVETRFDNPAYSAQGKRSSGSTNYVNGYTPESAASHTITGIRTLQILSRPPHPQYAYSILFLFHNPLHTAANFKNLLLVSNPCTFADHKPTLPFYRGPPVNERDSQHTSKTLSTLKILLVYVFIIETRLLFDGYEMSGQSQAMLKGGC